MTLITVAIHADGKVKELLTDEAEPSQHQTYDTDGLTLLSTVAATDAELIMLSAASPPATPAGSVLSGSGSPADSLGTNGDTYVDVDTNLTYGPKAGGVWPVGAVVELARA